MFKLVSSLLMITGSLVGMTLSQLDLIAQGEPKIVLQLSWAALLFAGFDGLMIATEDD